MSTHSFLGHVVPVVLSASWVRNYPYEVESDDRQQQT